VPAAHDPRHYTLPRRSPAGFFPFGKANGTANIDVKSDGTSLRDPYNVLNSRSFARAGAT
jgi:hypothetical protein